MIAQKLKRFLFRRVYLPMGDTHEALTRVRSRLDEMDAQLVKKHNLSPPQADAKSLENRLRAFQLERIDSFFKVVGDETDAQWDRIVDRRASACLWTILALIIGFILGKL
jgi:hypothetical protein